MPPLPIDLPYLALAAAAFLVAQATVPFAVWLGRRIGIVDPVRPDKIHALPMVRCGGVGIYLSFMITLGAALGVLHFAPGVRQWLPASVQPFLANVPGVLPRLGTMLGVATLMFVTGLIDDYRPLPPVPKLLIQLAAGALLAWGGITVRAFLPGELPAYLLTMAWVVLLSNSINFLDNMDGLSAGIVAACALNFYLVSRAGHEWFMMALFAIFLGSAVGFLRFNATPAKLFMGDSGSLFLGTMLAALSAQVTYYQAGVPTRFPVAAPLIILGVPLFDTATVMLIRYRAGLPLMKGDQNHFSHRLVALGFSRPRAVSFIWALTLAMGLPATYLRFLDTAGAMLAVGQAVLLFALIFLLEQVARGKKVAS